MLMNGLYGQCHSWNMVDNNCAIKTADKSVFLYHGTGIPSECRWFWKADNLVYGQRLNIKLSYQGIDYKAYIKLGLTGRTQMVWFADLTKVLESMFPYAIETQVYPDISFIRKGDTCYDLKFAFSDDTADGVTAESQDYIKKLNEIIVSDAKGFRMDVEDMPESSHVSPRSSKPGVKKTDYEKSTRAKAKLGLAGELAVLQFEKNKLSSAGIHKKVEHTSQVSGDGAGYDILSYQLDGTELYIEVKTTSGDVKRPFYMSANEVQFSKDHPESYALYRLYNFDPVTGHSNMYICKGDITEWVELKPENYVVTGFRTAQ